MVGVHRDDSRFALCRQRARHGLGHTLRRGHRHAGVPAERLHVGDFCQRLGRLGDAAGRKRQRVAAGQDDLPDRRARPHIVERRGEVGRAQQARARTDTFAAKAEPAIDRANRDQFDQYPVGIAMHQSVDRAHCIVADWIVALGGMALKLPPVGNELARDRVVGVAGLNERGERRAEADRIALRDRLELREPLRRSEPRFDEGLGSDQASRRLGNSHGLGRSKSC